MRAHISLREIREECKRAKNMVPEIGKYKLATQIRRVRWVVAMVNHPIVSILNWSEGNMVDLRVLKKFPWIASKDTLEYKVEQCLIALGVDVTD